MSIANLLEKEENIKGLVDMLCLFVLQVAKKDNMYHLTKYFFLDITFFFFNFVCLFSFIDFLYFSLLFMFFMFFFSNFFFSFMVTFKH